MGKCIVVHELRNYGVSCLNRDEFGQPKVAYFGDYLRGRISSQCKKRAMCQYFRKYKQEVVVGDPNSQVSLYVANAVSTRDLKDLVIEVLSTTIDPKTGDVILDVTDTALMDELNSEKWFKSFSAGEKSDVMQKYSWSDVEAILACVYDRINGTHTYVDDDKRFTPDKRLKLMGVDAKTKKALGLTTKKSKEIYILNNIQTLYDNFDAQSLKEKISWDAATRQVAVDIALFGRMSVLSAVTNVEAAMCVSHAISTHKLRQEGDYFIAVDEVAASSGAGHMNTKYYNSCCYYQYYSLDLDLLNQNLGIVDADLDGSQGIMEKQLRNVFEAIVKTTPGGHQKDMASVVAPELMIIEITDGMPCSYANAFVNPVRVNGSTGVVHNSVDALVNEAKKLDDMGIFEGERFILDPNGFVNASVMPDAVIDKNYKNLVEDVLAQI